MLDASSCARRTACRSWSTPARPGWCCRPRPATASGEILAALDRLEAGGSTNGGDGIRLAYAMAKQAYLAKGGVNRVILATDGDFNVGTVDQNALETLVADQRKSGHRPDHARLRPAATTTTQLAERLADVGDGNHAYIDTPAGSAQGAGARKWASTLDDHRPRREDPDRIQPGAGRRVPPDRLREPPAASARISPTTRSMPATSARATR